MEDARVAYQMSPDNPTDSLCLSLGAVARLRVFDPKKLEDPILHRIPNRMLEERLRAYNHANKVVESPS